eukprot:scaffold47227_cov34-Tisochrysis_lutea.AAC.2
MPRPGVLLVDRHIEKNGGTSFRQVLLSAERAGRCMYWGFSQKSAPWKLVIEQMRSLRNDSQLPHLCIEAHNYIDYGGLPWSSRLAQLQSIRAQWASTSVPMQVLLHVRFREPLHFYISFYTWIVAPRQVTRNSTMGHNFTEWLAATPNLQAEILLNSKAALTAAYGGLTDADRRAWQERWPDKSDHNASGRAAEVWETLAAYDVIGTTERYDECVGCAVCTAPFRMLIPAPRVWQINIIGPPQTWLGI